MRELCPTNLSLKETQNEIYPHFDTSNLKLNPHFNTNIG